MADNPIVYNGNPGGTNYTVAGDDLGSGVIAQRVKIIPGSDGVNEGDVASGNGLPVKGEVGPFGGTAGPSWTSATSLNTTYEVTVSHMSTLTAYLYNTSTMTAGVLTFEVTADGTNWKAIQMARTESFTVETTYILNTVADRAWTCNVTGFYKFRVRLSTVITGSGTATVLFSTNSLPTNPVINTNASPASVISTANSSTVVLAANAVFTGTAELVKDYAAIVVNVYASHGSTGDGFSIQFSSDGTNWDISSTYTVAATTGYSFTFQPEAAYFRLQYTNLGTLQTSFRLQTIFHYTDIRSSSRRPDDAISNSTDTEQVSSFEHMYNGTTWDRVRGDTTNGLDVDVTRLPTLVAGTAIIGKVGIDQTTPGTTNKVSIDQTTPGTTNKVSIDQSSNGSTNAVYLSLGGPVINEDSVLSGGAVRVGVRASNARPTAMSADNDIISPASDLTGQLYTLPGRAATATLANVSGATSNTSLIASNTSRKGFVIVNDSTAILYISFGGTASATAFTYRLFAQETLELINGVVYTGAINGIWSAATGSARCTELTG